MNRRNGGQVLVLVAFALFFLMGMAALGIDVAFMYTTRNELQRCADSGALAGASAFTTADWQLASTKTVADARARDFASRDAVVRSVLDPGNEVAVAFPQVDRIQVTTSRNVNLFFARVLGMGNRLITATAVAEAAVTDLTTNCIKPWAIPYPWNDLPGTDKKGDPTTPNGLYDLGEEVYTTCNGGVGLCEGSQIIVKIGTPNDNTSPSGQQSAGQFFIIQGNLGGSNWFTGGSQYEEYISGGCFDVDLSLPLDLMTGDKVGPTRHGVQDLLDGDPAATWDSSTNRPQGSAYTGDDWVSSPRIVRVAIYDPSVPMMGSVDGHGTHTYVQPGYSLAGFWIESLGAQGTVTGRYIPAQAFGSSSGNAPGAPTGTEVKTVRLVQ